MADLNIRAVIELLVKGKGGKEAADQLRQLEREAKSARAELERSGKATSTFAERLRSLKLDIGDLGKAFVGLFAARQVFNFIRSAITDFAQLSRTLSATRVEMKNLGIDSRELRPVVDRLREIERGGGALMSETLPAFQKFIGITKSTAAALYLTNLSATVSESGLISAGEAAEGLANILQGRAAQAALRFGIELRKANGEVKSNAELLDEIEKLYKGVGDEISDTQNDLDRLTGSFADFKREVGESIAPLVSLTVALTDALARMSAIAREAPKLTLSVFDVGPGYFARIRAQAEKLARAAGVQIGEAEAEGLDEGRKAALEKANAEQAKADREFWRQAEEEQAKEIAQGFEAIAEARKKAEEKAAADAKELAEQRAAFEEKTRDEFLRAELDATAEHSDARLKAELAILERTREKALAEAERLNADKLAVEQVFQVAKDELISEFEAARHEALGDELEREQKELERAAEQRKAVNEETLRDLLEQEIAGVDERSQRRLELELALLEQERQTSVAEARRLGADVEQVEELFRRRKLALEQRAWRSERAIDVQRKAEKIAQAAEIAQAAAQAATLIFSKSKALAIASAVVDTWAGAAKAIAIYGPTPFGWAMFALAIARGFAAVRAIRQTNLGGGGGGAPSGGAAASAPAAQAGTFTGTAKPGGPPPIVGGFDVPANDNLARMMTNRWAEDFLREAEAGWRHGLAQGGNPISNTYDNRRTEQHHYHLKGGIYDRRGLERFMRGARRAERLDRRRVR